MIAKERDPYIGKDKFEKAGIKAEKQMAFYLKREFEKDTNIFVFNNLRIEHEGEVAQIDHLILHPYGFALVESKSVTDSVEINEYDEWIRWYNDKPTGMRSPIIQLEMQRKVLVRELEANASKLLGKLVGIQTHFGGRKYDKLVAISDQGRIVRKQKTNDIYKADMVTSVLRKRIKGYRNRLITGDSICFTKSELKNILNFLSESNQEKIIPQNTVSEPNKPYTTVEIKYHTPPFSCPNCEIPFDIRYSRNHYLYCQKCRLCKPLTPLCPKCGSSAKVELVERVTTYSCNKNTSHHGIFYKNNTLWVKDKNKLASEKT